MSGDLLAPLKLPALGRHFSLGTLYDFRTDEIIPVSLPQNDLKPVKIVRNDSARFTLVTPKKMGDHMKDLNVNDSIPMSILASMIGLENSASYMNKKINGNRKSSNVRCQYRTVEKELTMDLSDKIKINNFEIAKTAATHVVTKIQYGAEATFTFTKQINETDEEDKVKASLASKGKYLIRALEGKTEVKMFDENYPEQRNETDIECHFESDFQLPKNVKAPTTYEEAVKFASDFTKIVSESIVKDTIAGNDPLGVPCFIWLYPLDFMQTSEMGMHAIMVDYDNIEAKLYRMQNDPQVKQIRQFDRKLQRFCQNLMVLKRDLKTKLRDSVISIRNSQESVSSLKKLMERINDQQFSFNPNRLNAWLSEKHFEMRMLKRFQDLVKTNVKNQEKILFFPSSEKLQESMTDSKVRFGFEIAFNQIKSSEPFLELMKKQLLDVNVNEDEAIENKLNKDIPWYKKEQIEKKMEIFVKLINEHFEDEAFALTAPDNEHEDDSITSGLSLVLYYEGIKYCGCRALLVLCKQYQNHNLEKIIRLLLDRNINVNCRHNEGWNALHLISRHYKNENLIDIIKLLTDKNIDVNCKTNDGWNALHFICRFYEKKNVIDIIRLLIKQNIDVHSKTKSGNNALLYLCEHYQNENFLEIVQLFLEQNVNINNKNNEGWKALHLICRNYKKENLFEIVQLLLNRNIDINSKEKGGNSAFLILCQHFQNHNLIGIIQLFLDKNTNLNCRNNEGWNALHLVCRYYKKENLINIVKLFLDKNIETNRKTNSGCNVLHIVCRYYHNCNLIEIVQLLLETGISVSFTNNEGWNALLNVCRYYPNDNLIDLVELFLDRGVDVNWVNNEGFNALHLVCRFYKQDNMIQVMLLLLDKNIDVNRKTKNGLTALLLLCEQSQTDNLYELVKLLLERNVDVNCKDDDGWNALHFVCGHYQRDNLIDIIKLLIHYQIDVNCKTNEGWNALHFVCRYQPKSNLMDLVQLLIQHNIEKDIPTTGGKIGSAHSFLLDRFEKEDVKDVMLFLESKS